MKKLSKSELKQQHISNLSVIFEVHYSEMKVIFKDLKAIEMNGHKLAEDYCNGIVDSELVDVKLDVIKSKLRSFKISPEVLKNLHLNLDPRGYFLKIDDDFVRSNRLNIETDWGGYGIICPEGL